MLPNSRPVPAATQSGLRPFVPAGSRMVALHSFRHSTLLWKVGALAPDERSVASLGQATDPRELLSLAIWIARLAFRTSLSRAIARLRRGGSRK